MLAFNNDPAAKELALTALWKASGKGGVASRIHGFARLGIPVELVTLMELFCARLPHDIGKAWLREFLSVVLPGTPTEVLRSVWLKFAARLLDDSQDGVIWLTTDDSVRRAITRISQLYYWWADGEEVSTAQWTEAAEVADCCIITKGDRVTTEVVEVACSAAEAALYPDKAWMVAEHASAAREAALPGPVNSEAAVAARRDAYRQQSQELLALLRATVA